MAASNLLQTEIVGLVLEIAKTKKAMLNNTIVMKI